MFSVYCLPVAYYERSDHCLLRSDVARSSRHGPKGRGGLFSVNPDSRKLCRGLEDRWGAHQINPIPDRCDDNDHD